ncbi:OmpH family outer membrane protein [Desulfogranum mediterraneum]|uniref:OmpH family outer membrane protein n=1 Tax=Desulfogranum mediterraneum TaxID=160661 RepID=UPI000402B35F|nr:OmpH family outer membrane protein [Desulfogranum mediterraneum]
MKIQTRIASLICGVLFFGAMASGGSGVQAAEVKIGVINMQKVLAGSDAGKKAQATVSKKMKELQAGFKKDEQALLALQKEIEKKSSAWSDEMKQEKAIDFQKMRRDLGVKQEDANLELKKLREQEVGPIINKLQGVVQEVAQEQGYTLIIPHNVVLFATDKIDLTATVTTALNKAMK